ncbi:MAG: hypothetical protein LBL57_06870 [Tannerella sp.]|jgi:hypothetical protein|nr:hypothetical protein [Tannerella sp.]
MEKQTIDINSARYLIGIDPGTNCGIAVYCKGSRQFGLITTVKIHRAMDMVLNFYAEVDTFFVRVEDARLRQWFGRSDRERLQGAGSIKRDCKIWEDFLTDNGIAFELVAPRDNMTKLSAAAFKKMTGYRGHTGVNGRDAAMLVYGF